MPKINVMPPGELSTQTRQVTLTVTEDCNLRCRYCYEPNKSRGHHMSIETAKSLIHDVMIADDGFQRVQFDFFGGEPLLEFNLIREVVDWFHSNEWGKAHSFFIGTNGTILTEEMKAWLIKYERCITVGFSLDGNKQIHDKNRSNSYDAVLQNLPFYNTHWPNQPAKMTINAETIPFLADCIIDLEEKEIPFTANLVYENIWGNPEQKQFLLRTYEEQLDLLVQYYIEHPNLFPALILDRKLEYVKRPSDKSNYMRDNPRWCGAGVEMVMFDYAGNRYDCHRLSPWVTGKPAPESLVNRHKEWKPDTCNQCRLVEMCPICIGYNWEVNGDPAIRTTYHCEAFKLEVLASAKLQVARLMDKTPEDMRKLPDNDIYNTKRQIETALELVDQGI